MSVKISTEATNQLTNKDVSIYTNCKLYDYDDSYLTDLRVTSAIWNKSRKFGVSVLNLTILNSGGRHDFGQSFELKSDYIVVLREGFDTESPTDKFPKFKGLIKDVAFDVAGGTINLTIYDELILTQRSDMDHIFSADTTLVENETMAPIVAPITTILENSWGNRVRLAYTVNNFALDKLVAAGSDDGYFYVGDTQYKITNVNLLPNGTSTNEVVMDGWITGTLIAGDTITNASRSFTATIDTGVTGFNAYAENVLKLTSINGYFSNGEKLYKSNPTLNTSVYITAKSFYEVYAVEYYNARNRNLDLSTGDVVHDGFASSYRSANPNWAKFKSHSIQVLEHGIVTEDDTYSGYEVNHAKGLIRLNHPVRVDKFNVKATYNYFPVGLYCEDVLTEIITMNDQLEVDLIINGGFNQLTTNWADYYGDGAVTTDFNITTDNELNIEILKNLNAGEYVGKSQSIDVLKGFTYTITAIVKLKNGDGGTFNIQLDTDNYTNTGDNLINNATLVSFTHTPTTTGSVNLNIFVSGASVDAGDIWYIDDVHVNYNPAKTNALEAGNLYCTTAIENGSTDAYTLHSNSAITTIPRYSWLTSKITNVTTSINVKSTTGFPSSGKLLINNEYISYTGVTSTTFTGITRGEDSTTQVDHEVGIKAWQTLPSSRVWYMEYSNIIPKDSDDTASTYDAVNGVNVGSAASFTITGASFSEFFYREGLMITDTPATSVVLDTNTNYYFNQIQSTGVELSYMLIDYREVNNKFDAINEVRSLIAPNYVISTVVRSAALDTYTTYVKGRYLTQKSTGNQDYNLNFIGNLIYKNDVNVYNRVKMFGKLADPTNLMYSPSTSVMNIMELDTEYIKGVEYKYDSHDGKWTYYSQFSEDKFTDITYPLVKLGFEYDYYNNKVYILNTINQIGTDYFLTKLTTFDGNSNLVAGCITSPGMIVGPNNYLNINVNNVYYVNYTKGTTFTTGDKLTANATIKYVKQLDDKAPYDSMIMVQHNEGEAVFTQGTGIVTTDSTTSGTIANVILDGNVAQVNYTINARYTHVIFEGFYDVIYNTNNKYIEFTADSLANPIGYTLNIDGYEYNQDDYIYETKIHELGKAVEYGSHDFGGGIWPFYYPNWSYYWSRELANDEIYLNDGIEFFNHPYIPRGELIPLGTVHLEQHDGDSVNGLLTINYNNQATYNDVLTRDTNIKNTLGTIMQQINDGTKLYYSKDQGHNAYDHPVKSAIMNATHIRYYIRYGGTMTWDLFNNYVRISTDDLIKSHYKPEDIEITLDGQFTTVLPSEFNSDSTNTTIERIRDFNGKGRDEQIGIVSRKPIGELPLAVIDLGDLKNVKYIDIQPGYLYKSADVDESPDEAAYNCNFKITLKYTNRNIEFDLIDDDDFDDISEETKDVETSTGEIVTFDESQLGENFKTRYLKIYVSTADKADITIGTDKTPIDWYGATIGGIAIYESDVVVSEKYVNSNIINLYKDNTVYEQLYTQELLDVQCQSKLNEFQKDNTKINAINPWSPHLEVGQTLYVNDTESGATARNYFIESIGSNNGQIQLELAYYGGT